MRHANEESPAGRLRVVVIAVDFDEPFEELLSPIREVAEVFVAYDAASLEAVAADADALFVWDGHGDLVDRAIALAPRLRWVHSSSTGVNDLITPALTASGVVLTNSRGVLDRAIAEYVLGMYIAHRKGFGQTRALQAERRWQHRTTLMVSGTNAVVVGTGAIGRETARLLAAVGVSVTLVGRRAADDAEFGAIMPSSELAGVVSDAQLLVMLAPLTPATQHLLNQTVLDALPSDAYLVNVGRGGLIDEAALTAHISKGKLAGAGLDVFAEEPLPVESPLWSDPNVFVSPHMAGDFEGFDAALVQRFFELLRDRTAGRPLNHVVDTSLGYVPS